MPEPGNLQVVLMGLITVFAALVILIVMIKLMSSIINAFVKSDHNESEPAVAGESEESFEFADDHLQKLKVAIAVAIAEDVGEDLTTLRINSLKKL